KRSAFSTPHWACSPFPRLSPSPVPPLPTTASAQDSPFAPASPSLPEPPPSSALAPAAPSWSTKPKKPCAASPRSPSSASSSATHARLTDRRTQIFWSCCLRLQILFRIQTCLSGLSVPLQELPPCLCCPFVS